MSAKSNDLVRAWVPKEFHKKIKLEAARNETTMVNYLRGMCSEEEEKTPTKKKIIVRGGIDFGF